MRPTRPVPLPLLLVLSLAACRAPVSVPASTVDSTPSPASETPPSTPTASASPEPSLTPTPALLELQIVEWFEHPIPNLVDPLIQDQNVEILVHNPNDLPVYVDIGTMEFRLLNAAGEPVYTGGHGYFSLWNGSWMLPGESTGFQICVCFDTQGLERRDWEAIDLVARLSPATDAAYSTDVEATLGDPFSLAEAHLGGFGTGIPITLTNIGDRPLASIPMRVIARDAGGRYIGMAGFGNSVVSFTENIDIQPGESLYGVLDSEIDYFNGRLTYEIVAIGIPAR